MSHVKSLAHEILALPVEEAQAKVTAFLEDVIEACVKAVATKDVNQPREFNEGVFRIRADFERWKSLVHRLAAQTVLGEAVAVSRFETALRARLDVPARLTDAAFAAPKSPRQLQAEAEAAKAAEKAKKAKGRGKPKAKAKPRPKPKPAPTVVVKPHRPAVPAE